MPHAARLAQSDPRKGVGSPVRYHTDSSGEHPALPPVTAPDDPAPARSALWHRLRRNLFFWQPAADLVRVSVYGPTAATPGHPAKLSVYLHTADAAGSVRTLSRAFHHDSELIGAGILAVEVARGTELVVGLSVANAGVTRSRVVVVWRGQPHRVVFDLHVPWEAPGGPAPGAVTVGRDDQALGTTEFRLTLLPRKG
ncbi:MAG: hypothetical protein C0501_30620 [Isosphaera sp.]|nr:hypothetical protein [Isosphaera sp.]